LVFEDTDDGVAAGRAAGAVVIDVRRMAAQSACLPRI
jgi:beta-phosphoglucomutase-like phosphatase (HAD superfamily)